ncbi:MAG: hypothetical protein Q8M01_22955 [Rubrivivax sp.]|nr:hypothetical protein [Rubrivivax sp.]
MATDITSGLLLTRKLENETHGNHLRAPHIGVRDLHLKASGKRSRFHLPENAPDPGTGAAGEDGFNFLPEYDGCELVFDLDNPFDIVDRARLEVYRRFDKKPLWTLDLVKLGRTWLRHGVHTVQWKGQVFDASAEIAGTVEGEATKHDLGAQAAKPDAAADAPFPDGWLTLQHSPYKLCLVLESDLLPDRPVQAWTYFHVMLEKIEIKLGPEEVIPSGLAAPTLDMEKAVRKQFETNEDGTPASLPADGATAKVYLLSNLYKNSSAEFDPLSTTDHATYRDLWTDGPRIPLLARLWLRAADGSAVELATAAKGAVALGRARFLWDWKDPDEAASAADAEAVTYIANSRAYYTNATDATRAASDHTYPEGDNCHVDRGGARGPAAKPIFPDQPGYAPKATLDAGKFPFAVGTTVVDPKKRKWAAFSTGWTSGALKGHTGVLFRPSRMAGDNYIVSVQLAHDWDAAGKYAIDVTDKDLKLPAKITAKTGTFEVWRRLQLSRYVRKSATVPAFASFGAVAAFYANAHVDLRTAVTANDNYTMGQHKVTPAGALHDYNTTSRTLLTAAGFDLYDEGVIATTTEDHASVPAVFKVAPYATFVQRVHTLHLGLQASDFADEAALVGGTADSLAASLGNTGAPLAPVPPPLPGAAPDPAAAATNARRARLNQTRDYLRSQGYRTLRAFSVTLEEKLKPPAKRLAINYPAIAGAGPSGAKAKPGVVVLHWEYLHSGTKEYVDSGQADHDGLRGSAIDAVGRVRETVVFALWRPLVQTFAHEIGHHLFLPHTKPPHSDANALKVHDTLDPKCLMSYQPDRHGFCGQCLLRMRGWDNSKLDSDSTKNKKP